MHHYFYMSVILFDDLSGPEKIIVKHLSLKEPLLVINAWLTHNGFNSLNADGLERLEIKYHELILGLEGKDSETELLSELIKIKNNLINVTSSTEDPKAIAQLSNSLNTIAKTISDSIAKKNAKSEKPRVTSEEFLSVLKFLASEGYIEFGEGKFLELEKNLSE